MTLIQQVVSDDRRGQIFAVLGSLVQTFTLVGTLAAGPITEAVGPRLMWGISAALLVVGFLNTVVLVGRAALEDRGRGAADRSGRLDRGRRRDPRQRVRADRDAARRGRADARGGRAGRSHDPARQALTRGQFAALACGIPARRHGPVADSARLQPVVRPETRELVLGVPDALLELPAVAGARQPASSFSSSAFAASSCAVARSSSISFTLTASSTSASAGVGLDLEEPGPGRELEHLVAAEVDARRAGLQRRDERRVTGEHADLAGLAGHDQHLGLAFVDGAVGRDDRDVELGMRVGHRRAVYAATCSSWRAFSTASSIGPTM